MRLTLRTLLAYLDSNLPADQAEELESKIKQSEAAQQLISRIRDVQGRVRLGSPSIHGRGTGGDPNSVAEYLDNRLRSEKTTEIEKICIESDMQLAEVAACHQILSQVLGKPLQSPHELRQRLYGIQDLVINEGQPHPDADFVRPANAVATAAAAPADANGSHGAWYYVLVGALSLSITLVALAGGTYLLGGFAGDRDDVGQNDRESANAEDDKTARSGSDASSDSKDDEETVVIPVNKVPLPGDGDAPNEGTVPPPESPGEGLSGGSPTTAPADPEEEDPADGGPTIIVEEGAPPPPTSTAPEATAPETTDPPTLEVAGPTAIGSVADLPEVSNLVALFDEQNVDASRVLTGGKIMTGASYVTFPLFESGVYASPYHFRFQGDSHWGFEAAKGDGPMTLRLDQGTMRVIADQPATLNVRLNGHVEPIRFEEPGTELAMRVTIERFPGDDPRSVVSPHAADYCLIKGKATLGSSSPVRSLEVAKPMRWTEGAGIVAVEPPPASENAPASEEGAAAAPESPPGPVLPNWIDELKSPLEEKAVTDMLANLPAERSLKLSLMEIAGADHREEVQAIATWALCSLQFFDPALESFRDAEQRSYWRTTLRAIRRDLPLSPASATSLRTAVANKYPVDAEIVWAMLLGYSPEQLPAGGDAELVGALEHPDLAVRVLAFLNLFAITDITHTYRPEVVENRRRSAVNRWQQTLRTNGVRYLHLPVAAQATQESEPDAATPSEEPGEAPAGAAAETPASPDDGAPGIFEEDDAPAPPAPGGETEATAESEPAADAPLVPSGGPLVLP